MVTLWPLFESATAAPRPAIPVPTITMLKGIGIDFGLVGELGNKEG